VCLYTVVYSQRVTELARKNVGFWKSLRGDMPTAWDLIDRHDIGPPPEWIKKGQKLETLNGELTAYIARVEEERDGSVRVWLTWAREDAPKGPEAWTLSGIYDYWRPAV
jgi:hypothetical protein